MLVRFFTTNSLTYVRDVGPLAPVIGDYVLILDTSDVIVTQGKVTARRIKTRDNVLGLIEMWECLVDNTTVPW